MGVREGLRVVSREGMGDDDYDDCYIFSIKIKIFVFISETCHFDKNRRDEF